MKRFKYMPERLFVRIMMLLAFISLIACSGTEVGNPGSGGPGQSSDMASFNDDSELENYLKTQYANSALDSNFTTELATGGNPDGVTADEQYSQTNVQEAGVDESDMVKTDGRRFYVASGRTLKIVDISEPMQVQTELTFEGYVDGLYLYESLLLVLFTPDGWGGDPWLDDPPATDILVGMPYWIPIQQKLGVAIYDISDPSQPRNLKTVQFDGHLVSSRLVESKLHVVQQYLPVLPPLEIWYDGETQDPQAVSEANMRALAGLTLADFMPSYEDLSDGEQETNSQRLVSSQDCYYPVTKDGGGSVTTVVSFELNDPELSFSSVGIVSDAHIVYASTRALYIATHSYETDLEGEGSYSRQAVIYKFDLTGEQVTCVGGGGIDGWILNQFSLGEHEDVLRVAVTTGNTWGTEPTSRNHVYCLQALDGNLEIIGKLEDIAPGETIYAARFIGDKGYLVTFVMVDPLFTLDLSNPQAPLVVGELKVPGYSDYIHPFNENYLITIGKDVQVVDDMTWYQGVQLSIFDIRTFSNPSLLHKQLIGDRGTSSEALYQHKAFTFWAGEDLLALPIRLYEHLEPATEPWQWGTETFNGLYVYRVSTDNGFDYLGRISTEDGNGTYYYSGSWTRGIFVDQHVYAVTDNAVRSAEIDNIPESIQNLYFEDEGQ